MICGCLVPRDFNYVRSEYVQAERWLNILSVDPEVASRVELEQLHQDVVRIADLEEKVESINKLLTDPDTAPIMCEALRKIEEKNKK